MDIVGPQRGHGFIQVVVRAEALDDQLAAVAIRLIGAR